MGLTAEQKELCACRHPRVSHPKKPEAGFMEFFASLWSDMPDDNRNGSCRMRNCDCTSFHKGDSK